MRLRRWTVIVLCLASLRLMFVAHDIRDLSTHAPFYDDSFDSFGRSMQDAAHDVCLEPIAEASVLGVPGGERSARFTTFWGWRRGPRRTPSRTSARVAGVRGVDAATAS